MSPQELVIFEELATDDGHAIGVATLNSPRKLNALDLNMIQLLLDQLLYWQQDKRISCVLLQGSGEKAFCAGGDVVGLYEQAASYNGDISGDAGLLFFTQEYRLDYLIHTFKKPIIAWGNGVIMGGGLGLMNGASHRIVTEDTNMAMPEVSIGLYPDVGATKFLTQAPEGVGLFLGLTGININAADAKYTSLADYFVENKQKESLLSLLKSASWSNERVKNCRMIDNILMTLEHYAIKHQPEGNIEKHLGFISESTALNSTIEIVNFITDYNGDDKWLSKASNTLKNGCPVTPFLVHEQIRIGKTLSLKECFKFELSLSVNCLEYGNFKEGVRALLIDKDKHPQWQPKNFSDVSPEIIQPYLASRWNSTDHPLNNL